MVLGSPTQYSLMNGTVASVHNCLNCLNCLCRKPPKLRRRQIVRKQFWLPIWRPIKISPPKVEKPMYGTELCHHVKFHADQREISVPWQKIHLFIQGTLYLCLEQSATACHFCAFSSRLCISAEITYFFSVSFSEQFWMYSACEVPSSLFRHANQSSHLLTYSPGGYRHPMLYIFGKLLSSQCYAATYRFRDIRGQNVRDFGPFGVTPKGETLCPGQHVPSSCKMSRRSVSPSPRYL